MIYHFFSQDEIKDIFDHNLNPIEQNIKFVDHPNEVALVETLFQKKADSNCQKTDENN
jgi:hypothetical protein